MSGVNLYSGSDLTPFQTRVKNSLENSAECCSYPSRIIGKVISDICSSSALDFGLLLMSMSGLWFLDSPQLARNQKEDLRSR